MTWYIHKLEPLLEIEKQTILRDFEIQTYSIFAARPCVNKQGKNCHLVDLIVPVDHRVKRKRKDRQRLGS